jgi:hypothetical protein
MRHGRRGLTGASQFGLAATSLPQICNLKDTNDIAGSTDLDGMMGWLDDWCQANPTKNFAYAAWHLVNFLYPSRKRRE